MKEKIEITLPTSWQSISEKQLLQIYQLMAEGLSNLDVKTRCLLDWSNSKIYNYDGIHILICIDGKFVLLEYWQFAEAIRLLDWIDTIPDTPIRLPKICNKETPEADFENVNYEQWLCIDNYYCGYLATQDKEHLESISKILVDEDNIEPTSAELIGVFYWIASLKLWMARKFPNFLKTSETQEISSIDLERSVQAQIRALSDGDITKESAIMKCPCLRALAELDAKARDYEELVSKHEK